MCARPSLEVKSVSSWGGTRIFYKPEMLIQALKLLLDADVNPNHPNYSYDLCDITRQVLSDYSKSLLEQLNVCGKESIEFQELKAKFLELILDTDQLLGTNENFRLGHWTERARDIALEMNSTTSKDRDWLELNARSLITTWGDRTIVTRVVCVIIPIVSGRDY